MVGGGTRAPWSPGRRRGGDSRGRRGCVRSRALLAGSLAPPSSPQPAGRSLGERAESGRIRLRAAHIRLRAAHHTALTARACGTLARASRCLGRERAAKANRPLLVWEGGSGADGRRERGPPPKTTSRELRRAKPCAPRGDGAWSGAPTWEGGGWVNPHRLSIFYFLFSISLRHPRLPCLQLHTTRWS